MENIRILFKNIYYLYNMKDVIIIFYGLIRTAYSCIDNINQNIINYNKNFNIKYLISTQCDKNKKEDELNDQIYSIFGKNNIIDILHENIPNQKDTKEFDANYIIMRRLRKAMDYLENCQTYDIYLFSRMDIIINNPIDLNKYNNDIFTIVTSIRPVRPCIFHNRDWDYLWFGSKKAFEIWYYSYIYGVSKVKEYKKYKYFTVHNKLNLNLDYNLSIEEKQQISNKYKLVEMERPKSQNLWWIVRDFDRYDFMYHKCINNLILNGCEFELSEHNNLYSLIVR